MYSNFSNKKLFLFFIGFSFVISLSGQTPSKTSADSSSYLSFQVLLDRIGQKYSVQFFYKTDWFANKKFSSSLADLPLEDALTRINKLTGYTYLTVDTDYYVFVPIEDKYNNPNDKSGILVIGNPNEFGKYSKATLKGKILDGKTGEPLLGAVFAIEKLKVALTTDANGSFSIKIPVGEYEVKMKYIGYEDNVRKIKIVSDGKIDLELFEKSVHLDEVVISSERSEHNVTRTQMSLVRFTSKTIKELPVSMGEIDIIKSVSMMPGIQSVGEFGSGFNVRGGSADQNLLLVNDMPLFNSSHLFGLTSSINPDGVKDVTLLKTGIPAKYGERASSVMEIEMGSDKTDNLRFTGGIGLLNSRLNFQAPLFKKKVFIQIGGRSSYSNWLLKQMPDVELQNSSANFYDVNGLIAYNVNSNNKLTLFGYFSKDKFSFNNLTHYEYNNLLGSLKWNHVFSNKLSSVFILGTSHYDYAINELDASKPTDAYQLTSAIDYNKLKWNFSWSPNQTHTIDIGINGMLYDLNPGKLSRFGSVSEVLPKKLSLQKALEASGYISDNISINQNLSAELGMRFTKYLLLGPRTAFNYKNDDPLSTGTMIDTVHYGNNHVIYQTFNIEPRFSIRYSLDDASSIKASYTKINQFINLISNTAVMSPTDIWQLSNSFIKPLSNDQFGIGYFRNFLNNSIETSVELYYKRLNNIIEYKDGAQILLNDHLETDLLNAKGYNYGMELYAKKNTGKLTGWLSYTYSKSMRRTSGSDPTEQINNNQYYNSPYDQPHNLVLNANYRLTRRWKVGGTFTYNTGRPVTIPEYRYMQGNFQLLQYSERNKYRLPDFHRLDLSITLDESLKLKKKWKGSWTLSIINVYGRKNAYSVFYHQSDPTSIYALPWLSKYNLYKYSIIGRPLPTITYNFTF